VDSAWEQKKLEARKMLENAAESPASSAPSKISHHFIREKQGRMSRQGFDRLSQQLDNQEKVYSKKASE